MQPVVQLESISDQEVQHCTGFCSLAFLLSYTAIISDGDVTNMGTTVSTLTWFEEWFLYFEMIWGKTVL